MKRWAKPGVIAAAAVLAIAAGTAAYAMHATGASSKAAQQGTEAAATATAARPGPAACANEHPDCNDLQTAPPELTCEEADACATGIAPSCTSSEVPCKDLPGVCTNDGICTSPAPCDLDIRCQIAPVPPTAVCPDGVPIESCYPNARPAGPYVCEAPAPGTSVPTCYPPYCEQPDPAGDVPPPTCAPVEPPPCPPVEEKAGCGCTVPLDEGATRMACPPPDCSTSSDGTVACPPPPSPCKVLSDGTTACPEPMPPCAISSDGVVTCPMPVPPDCGANCSEPGAPPSGGGVTNSGTVTPG